MKITGICFFLLGAIALVVGFFQDVSAVVSYVPPRLYGPDLYAARETAPVANFHAMHIQALIFQAAFVSFLVGAIFFAAGAVAERLDARARADGAQPAAAASPAGAAPAEAASLFPIWGLVLAIAFVVIVAVVVMASSVGNDSADATAPGNAANAARQVEGGIADDPAASDAEAAIRQADSDIANAQGVSDAEAAIRQAESDIASGRLTSDEENVVRQAQSDIANASR